ncbi:MAG TPA: hypothetical protein VMF32_11075 [Xanthobacteraceae bacterium]|nr:hypothetical protein [Xanthobacteraceae bacterium]
MKFPVPLFFVNQRQAGSLNAEQQSHEFMRQLEPVGKYVVARHSSNVASKNANDYIRRSERPRRQAKKENLAIRRSHRHFTLQQRTTDSVRRYGNSHYVVCPRWARPAMDSTPTRSSAPTGAISTLPPSSMRSTKTHQADVDEVDIFNFISSPVYHVSRRKLRRMTYAQRLMPILMRQRQDNSVSRYRIYGCGHDGLSPRISEQAPTWPL